MAQAPEATSDDLLGAAEIARRFGVRRDAVYRAVRAADDPLPCFRAFGRLMFRAEEVEEWLERRRFSESAEWKPPW